MRDEDRIAADAARWQARLTGGAASPQDWASFDEWRAADRRHASAADEMATLWQLAGTRRTRSRLRTRRLFVAGAGAAAAAAGAFVVLPRQIETWRADVVTLIGERRDVELPGTRHALLNTDTVLRFDGPDHIVVPRGEALFDVPGGASALVVSTSSLSVRAADATFAVAADGPRSGVQVVSGVVHASVRASEPLVAVGSSERLRTGAVRPEPADALDLTWRQGVLAFRRRRLGSVAEELDRYRQGRIVILSSSLRERTVSGSLSLDRPDAAVVALAELFGLSVRFLPGGLAFLGEAQG